MSELNAWLTNLLRDLEFFQDSDSYNERADSEGLLFDLIEKVRKRKRLLDLEEAMSLE